MANRIRVSEAERFWEKVDQSGGAKACHPWIGSLSEKGYGKFRRTDSGKIVRAHRYAWALAHNVTPDALPTLGIDVHHTCETNSCVNAGHLEALDSDTHDRIHGRELRRMIRRNAR